MAENLFKLIAGAIGSFTLIALYTVYLDDRRKRRREAGLDSPSQKGDGADRLEQRIVRLEEKADRFEIRMDKIYSAVRTHRAKIKEVLQKISDNSF